MPTNSDSLPQRLAEGFADRLAPHFILEQLELHPASVFGMLPDGRIAYVNPAWVRFARDNGAAIPDANEPWMGLRYLDVIAAPLRPFYEKLFALAPDAASALQPVSHVYECSSATMFRQFAMKIYALAHGEGFVVINTLVDSRPHDNRTRVAQLPDRSLYETAEGLIVQCAHCRLVRRGDESRWDWVPAWIEQVPSRTSHGVCDVCFDYYFPAE